MNYFLLPKGIDFNAIAIKYLDSKNKKKLEEHSSKLKYIISSLLRMETIDIRYKEEQYFPLNAVVLRQSTALGYQYKYYLEALIKEGLIEVKEGPKGNATYRPGISSRSFRVSNPSFEIYQEKIKNKKILKFASSQNREIPSHLSKWFNGNLQVLNGGFSQIKLRGLARRHLLRFKMIQEGTYSLHVDRTSFRIHTPLTSMKKDLKPYLRYNMEHLVSIDLKTSQPFFLASTLLNPTFYTSSHSPHLSLDMIREYYYLKTINSSNNLIPNIIHIPDSTNYTSLFLHNVAEKLKSRRGDRKYKEIKQEVQELLEQEDVKRFKDWVLGDDVYQKFEDELCLDSRDEAKKLFYRTFYGSLRGNKLITTRMEQSFPSVFEVIRHYKLQSNAFPWVQKKAYASLAVLLQYLESTIFIDIISNYISQIRPEAPLYTIHDSFLTTPEHVKFVKGSSEQIIFELTGERPKMVIDTMGQTIFKREGGAKSRFRVPWNFE